MDQIRGVDKMGDSAGWDVYNNPIDGENVAPTNQDWKDQKQDPYMLPHAMVEADAIMNVFKQGEHSKLMSPGMQVDFYRRYRVVLQTDEYFIKIDEPVCLVLK